MIDIGQERCMTLGDLVKHLPVERSYRTLYRYATTGVLVRYATKRVRLETVWVGGERQSSVEAFERFLRELNQAEPVAV